MHGCGDLHVNERVLLRTTEDPAAVESAGVSVGVSAAAETEAAGASVGASVGVVASHTT